MAADFLCAVFTWPKGENSKQLGENFRERIAEVTRKIEGATFDTLGDWGHDFCEGHEGSEDELLKLAKEDLLFTLTQVRDAFINNSREQSVIFVQDTAVMITGGMSWSDAPTELCDSIWDLDKAGVT